MIYFDYSPFIAKMETIIYNIQKERLISLRKKAVSIKLDPYQKQILDEVERVFSLNQRVHIDDLLDKAESIIE